VDCKLWHAGIGVNTLSVFLAITGSNGKTIVKDALKSLLTGRQVLASPGSYNSQLGLPLAVLSAEKPEPLAHPRGRHFCSRRNGLRWKRLLGPTTAFSPISAWPMLQRSENREGIAQEKMKLFETDFRKMAGCCFLRASRLLMSQRRTSNARFTGLATRTNCFPSARFLSVPTARFWS